MSHHAGECSPAGPEPVIIEPGGEGDLPAIVDILNYTIMNSNATLATEPVSVADRREWLERFSAAGPYRLLVARRGSQVLGYAASLPFREHEGFRETVEVSIALDIASRGQGVGTALYRALLGCLADEPVHVALAGIVLPNEASVALHRKLGFTEVGTFHEYAVKNGRYLSSVWMERRFQLRTSRCRNELNAHAFRFGLRLPGAFLPRALSGPGNPGVPAAAWVSASSQPIPWRAAVAR